MVYIKSEMPILEGHQRSPDWIAHRITHAASSTPVLPDVSNPRSGTLWEDADSMDRFLSGNSLLFPLSCFEQKLSLMYCVSTACATYSLASHKYLLDGSNCHEAFISLEHIITCIACGN